MHKLLIPIVACLALSACANLEHASTQPRVSVYKYVGSVQCKGGGMPLATMMRQLSDAGIPALNVSCGRDGKIYSAMCGAADGHIGVLEVPAAKASAAEALGFALLSGLHDATKVACP
jgi:hypothetical protein